MKGAVVLLSGGVDSTVCLGLACRDHGAQEVIALSILYGQKHEREVKAAQAVAEHFKVLHIVKKMDPALFRGSGSTLTEADKPLPETTYEELRKSYGVSPTYVPFRNGNLLSAAASLALNEEREYIYAGMHAEDARHWAYPDCTPEFLGAMASAIYVGTYHRVRLMTPLMHMTKAEIVKQGWVLGVPFGLTWSCYHGGERPCGKCPTCVARKQAFIDAGVVDAGEYPGGKTNV